jgi:hypothetical protein
MNQLSSKKIILIKALGCGFWGEVNHLIRQFFLAETLNRVPVVYWGADFGYKKNDGGNNFENYYEKITEDIFDSSEITKTIFPHEWNWLNLYDGKKKNQGSSSPKIQLQYFCSRSEDILISDFYSSIDEIIQLRGLNLTDQRISEREICAEIFRKYLKPCAELSQKKEKFIRESMIGRFWIAVDASIFDDANNLSKIYKKNLLIWNLIDQVITLNPSIGIFLISNSTLVENAYRQRYGARINTLDNNVKEDNHDSWYDLGQKYMLQALIATECSYFVGLSDSCSADAIRNMKVWPDNFAFLLGEKIEYRSESDLPNLIIDEKIIENFSIKKINETERKVVLFYNDFHNGDVHMSRNYVVDLMNLFGDCDYYYFHKNNQRLLLDIENLKTTNEMLCADISINTWIGQFHYKNMDFSELAQKNSVFLGCNFAHYYAVMCQVYSELGFGNKIKSIEAYVPEINYSKFYTKKIDSFFSENSSFSVLVCNNQIMSGQAPEVDFDSIVEELANKYKFVNFIMTNFSENKVDKSNVYYSTNIINSQEKINDLNEISYISTRCQIILGRSSGPYSFSLVKQNTYDKTFVCICYFQKDSWTLGSQIDIRWTDRSSIDFLLPMLDNLIKEKHA